MGVVDVSLGTAPVTVQPGGVAAAPFVVRNTSATIQRVSFAVTGAAATWSSVEPASVSLLPGAEREVEMRFRPPRAPAPPAGTLTVAVRATPKDAPQDEVVEHCQLIVTPVQGMAAEIDPITSAGFRSGRHTVRVTNQGNGVMEVDVTAADPTGSVAVQVEPPHLSVGAGAVGRAKVKVRLVAGNRKDDTPRFFKVTATGATGPGSPAHSVTMDGALRIRRVPLRPIFGVLVAVAALVAGGVLYLTQVAKDDSEGEASPATTEVTNGQPGTTGAGGPGPSNPPPTGVASGTGERAALALGAPCLPTAGFQVAGNVLVAPDGTPFREFADAATATAARDLLRRYPTVCTVGNAANDDSELIFHPPPLQRTPAPPGARCTASYNPSALQKAPSPSGRTFAIEVTPRQFLYYSNEVDRERAFALLQGHTQICWLGGGDIFDTLFDWSRALAYF